MCEKKESEILYEAYQHMAEGVRRKKGKKATLKSDKQHETSILEAALLILVYLLEVETLGSTEKQKMLMQAKSLFIQHHRIKARNPQAVPDIADVKMDQLIRAVSRHEGEMLLSSCDQKTGNNVVSVEEVFAQRTYYNRLGSTLASVIYKDAIQETTNKLCRNRSIFYITKTGSRYHRKDCPFCRGRALIVCTETDVEKQKLTPCKCITRKQPVSELDHSCVTAFIDESIRPVRWDESGEPGYIGNYSYIICWGNLESESDITEEGVIVSGVEYEKEHEHIEKITEAAIEKVMIVLAYEYGFNGNLRIFTDNINAMSKWADNPKIAKMAELFQLATVSYIPRKENTIADRLVRKQIMLCIPSATYNGIVKKCKAYEEFAGCEYRRNQEDQILNYQTGGEQDEADAGRGESGTKTQDES